MIGVRVTVPFAQHWSVMLYGDVRRIWRRLRLHRIRPSPASTGSSPSMSRRRPVIAISTRTTTKNGFVWKMAAYGPYLGVGIGF